MQGWAQSRVCPLNHCTILEVKHRVLTLRSDAGGLWYAWQGVAERRVQEIKQGDKQRAGHEETWVKRNYKTIIIDSKKIGESHKIWICVIYAKQ